MRQPREGTTVLEHHRQLMESFPPLDARLVEVTTQATTAQQKFGHGLGRPYRGVLGPVSATSAAIFTWLPAEKQSDVGQNVTFVQSVAIANTIKVWVY